MQRLTLSHQQLCINRLLGQRMAKGKLICRLFNDQLGYHHLFEGDQQVSFIAVQHLLQQINVEAPPSNGCKEQQLPGIRTHVLCPLLHDILHTPGNRSLARRTLPCSIHAHQFPCGNERFEQLFHEKGIALGEVVERVDEISINGAFQGQYGTHHAVNIAAGEGPEREFLRQPFAIELGEPLPKSCMELITAIGDKQEERHIPTAAGQVQQKVQTEVVTPMDVLHHEEHGVSCRLIGKEMSHGSEEPSLLFFWINSWRRGKGRQVGEEQRQVWQQARERRDE